MAGSLLNSIFLQHVNSIFFQHQLRVSCCDCSLRACFWAQCCCHGPRAASAFHSCASNWSAGHCWHICAAATEVSHAHVVLCSQQWSVSGWEGWCVDCQMVAEEGMPPTRPCRLHTSCLSVHVLVCTQHTAAIPRARVLDPKDPASCKKDLVAPCLTRPQRWSLTSKDNFYLL